MKVNHPRSIEQQRRIHKTLDVQLLRAGLPGHTDFNREEDGENAATSPANTVTEISSSSSSSIARLLHGSCLRSARFQRRPLWA